MHFAARIARATASDQNGDGLLCVSRNWGQDLNPNSHWAEIWADLLSPPATEAAFISDNRAGTKQPSHAKGSINVEPLAI